MNSVNNNEYMRGDMMTFLGSISAKSSHDDDDNEDYDDDNDNDDDGN